MSSNLGKVTRLRRSEPRVEVSLDPLMLDVADGERRFDWRLVLLWSVGLSIGGSVLFGFGWLMYQLVLLVHWIVRAGL